MKGLVLSILVGILIGVGGSLISNGFDWGLIFIIFALSIPIGLYIKSKKR